MLIFVLASSALCFKGTEKVLESVISYAQSETDYWGYPPAVSTIEGASQTEASDSPSTDHWAALFEATRKLGMLKGIFLSEAEARYEFRSEHALGEKIVYPLRKSTWVHGPDYLAQREAKRRELEKFGINTIPGQASYFDEMLRLHKVIIKPTENRPQRYRVKGDVLGDGNCFFYSFLLQLIPLRPWMANIYTRDVRKMIVAIMKKHKSHLSGFVYDSSYEHYVQRLNHNEWADNLPISIVSALFGVRIMIFDANGHVSDIKPDDMTEMIGISQDAKIIKAWNAYSGRSDASAPEVVVYIGHLSHTHYVIVSPVSEEEASQYDPDLMNM